MNRRATSPPCLAWAAVAKPVRQRLMPPLCALPGRGAVGPGTSADAAGDGSPALVRHQPGSCIDLGLEGAPLPHGDRLRRGP